MTSVIKTIFGDKSAKDRKLIWPIVDQINDFQKSLESLSDQDLKDRYSKLKSELSDLIKIKKSEFESSELDEDEIDVPEEQKQDDSEENYDSYSESLQNLQEQEIEWENYFQNNSDQGMPIESLAEKPSIETNYK